MTAKIIAFIFGSIAGSFLNVCIHRMPNNESVVWPSSHCPHCKKMLIRRDVFSVLENHIKNGRCAFCAQEIAGIF